jgi:hypothetical protein
MCPWSRWPVPPGCSRSPRTRRSGPRSSSGNSRGPRSGCSWFFW